MSKSADGTGSFPGVVQSSPATETVPDEGGSPAPRPWRVLLKTLRHYFPDFRTWLQSTPDPRDPRLIVYPIGYELAAGLLMFMARLGARRQIRFSFQTLDVVANFNYLCGSACEAMMHPDTLAYLAQRMDPRGLEDLRTAMISRLIRNKCFDKDRLLGKWLRVAIDGSGYLSFRTRHCPQCLVQEHGTTTVYFHPVLEAKLVTPGGFCLSLATEFIETPDGADKQDCERKALMRLAESLKRDYPQLKICLLLDSLYVCGPVFTLCRQKGWAWIVTFKEGSAKAVFADYEQLLAAGGGRLERSVDKTQRAYGWVNDVDFSSQQVNVLECRETDATGKQTRFVWATSLPVDGSNVVELADQGGRQRWKIENQGFNVQKTNGYEMEHAYSEHPVAMRNFYLLLQIAHIIAQLIEKGLLEKDLNRTIGGLRNLARLLWEDLRRGLSDVAELERYLNTRIQIRFADTS